MTNLTLTKARRLINKHGNLLVTDENIAKKLYSKGFNVTPKYDYGLFVDACDRCLRRKILIGYMINQSN